MGRAVLVVWVALLLAAPDGLNVVRAESPQDFTAALGLSAADGTVRTRAGVRLELAPMPGAPDHTLRLGEAVRARMGGIRGCFAAAMLRTTGVHGRLVFALEARPNGRARVHLRSDDVQEPAMRRCIGEQLASTATRALPPGTAALVTLDLDNPMARVSASRPARPAPLRMLPAGLAESAFATQGQELSVRLVASAYASATLARLGSDLSERLAGLLDCRRKASGKRAAQGQVELDLRVGEKGLERAKIVHSTVHRRAAVCIEQWLARTLASRPAPSTQVALAVTFR